VALHPGICLRGTLRVQALGGRLRNLGARSHFLGLPVGNQPGQYVVPGVGPDGYVVRYQGQFMVPMDGSYGFELDAHGESRLSIDGQVLIASASQRGGAQVAQLAQGTHTLALEYLRTQGQARPTGHQSGQPVRPPIC